MASLEAWGSVAICLVHSETVFVSLVVRGSAALINTSAASHTYKQHEHNQAGTRMFCLQSYGWAFKNCAFFI